jgi:hypothetical protein
MKKGKPGTDGTLHLFPLLSEEILGVRPVCPRFSPPVFPRNARVGQPQELSDEKKGWASRPLWIIEGLPVTRGNLSAKMLSP